MSRVCALDDLTPGTARKVVVDGRALALVRVDDDVYALDDRCSHQDVSLSEGEVDVAERTLECYKHGSAFSLESGAPCSLPATRPVRVHEVKVVDGQVEVQVVGP